MEYLSRQQSERRTRNTNPILPPTKTNYWASGLCIWLQWKHAGTLLPVHLQLEEVSRPNLTHKRHPERSGPMLQAGRPRDAAFWTQRSGHCERRRVLPSTENRRIHQVWNPWKSGAGHTLHQNHRILASPDPSTYSQCGSGMPRCISAPSSACLVHDGCGCAARARRRAECIVPSTASPLLAGSWAPPCHRCPTKVCIAGRTGEEQPVLPLWDACHSNYLRSEPLLRRTFYRLLAWVVFLFVTCLTLARLCGF